MQDRANITIDTEKLRELLEEHAGEQISKMDTDSLMEAKEQLFKICSEQEGRTPARVCLWEAISWVNEKLVDRIIDGKA